MQANASCSLYLSRQVRASAKAILKARILLKADEAEGGAGWLNSQIVEALDTNLPMVMRTREKFVTEIKRAVVMQFSLFNPSLLLPHQ